MTFKVNRTEKEWKEILTEEEYRVLRQAGTERAFAGEYTDYEATGTYSCKGCDFTLFHSKNKFHSGCGWPSFWGELESASILQKSDTSHGMKRIELLCSNCGSHLGHIFNDGPPPTGKRYCINSICLVFKPDN